MNLDKDPAILEHELQEVLKSLGMAPNVVCFVIPSDEGLPDGARACDVDFHDGETYLAANQAQLACMRFERALSSFDGHSAYQNFPFAVRTALAEAYADVDVREWDKALAQIEWILV